MTTSSGVQNYFETDAYEENRARLLERREAAQKRARELAEKRRARELEIQRQLRVGEPARDDDALNSGFARGVKKKSRTPDEQELNARPTGAERNAHAKRKTRAEQGGEVDRDEQDLNSGAARGVKRAPRNRDDNNSGDVVKVSGEGRDSLPGAGDDSDKGGTILEPPDVVDDETDDEVETVTPDERLLFSGAGEPTDDVVVLGGEDEEDPETSYRDMMRVNRTQFVLLLHLQSSLGWSEKEARAKALSIRTVEDAQDALTWLSPQIGNLWPGLSYTSKNAAINDLLTDYEGREHEVTPWMIDDAVDAREALERDIYEAAKLMQLRNAIDNAVELGDEIVLTDEDGKQRRFVLNDERWLYEYTDDLSNPVKQVGRLTESELRALYGGGGLNYAAGGLFYPEAAFREKAVDVESTDADGNIVFGDLADALAGTFLTTDQHQFNIMTGEDGQRYMWVGGKDLGSLQGRIITAFKPNEGTWIRLKDEGLLEESDFIDGTWDGGYDPHVEEEDEPHVLEAYGDVLEQDPSLVEGRGVVGVLPSHQHRPIIGAIRTDSGDVIPVVSLQTIG